MTIWINGYEANTRNRVGSNVYAFELLHALYKKTVNDKVLIYLPFAPLPDLPPERKGWKYYYIHKSSLWSLVATPVDLWYRRLSIYPPDKVDCVLSLGQYAPIFPPFPSVICVMDLAYYQFPDYFRFIDYWKLRLYTSYSIRQAKKIIAISEATKRDIIKHFSNTAEKIEVSYVGLPTPGLTTDNSFIKRKKKEIHIPSPYLLFIGTIQPRKNLVRAIEAFEIAKKEKPDLQFVLIGKKGWKSGAVFQAISKSPVKESIHWLGYLDDAEKNEYLEGAAALILVGLLEGFGIPPLEALEKGVVPIVSNSSSLSEVIGNSGILVDPYNTQEIANGIIEACKMSKNQRDQLTKKSIEKRVQFTWDHVAEVVYSSLKEVSARNKR